MTLFDVCVGFVVLIAVGILGGEFWLSHQRRQQVQDDTDDQGLAWQARQSQALDDLRSDMQRRRELDALIRDRNGR